MLYHTLYLRKADVVACCCLVADVVANFCYLNITTSRLCVADVKATMADGIAMFVI